MTNLIDLRQNSSIYRLRDKSHLETKIFLDEAGTVDTARFETTKYPIFQKQVEMIDSLYWKPTEINMMSDRSDFQNKLEDHHRHIFTSNIKSQITGDSIQSRGLAQCLLPLVSDPMVESCIIAISYFENRIHSLAYTHILRGIYTNPSDIFDSMKHTPEIVQRAKVVSRYADDLIDYTQKYQQGLTNDIKGLKKRLYLYLVSVNALEGIQFYISFACSFAFGQNQLMKGTAEEIRLIANDEALHVAFNTALLRILPNDDPAFVEIYEECKEEAIEVYMSVYRFERDVWIDYLFQYGSMLGLNSDIAKSELDWLTVKRGRSIGLELPISNAPKSSQLSYMKAFLNESDVQKPPQDADLTGYIKGLKSDIDENSFDDFEL